MKINYDKGNGDELTISLSGDIGQDNIKELKDMLELRLSNSNKIKIIVLELEYFDLSTLQLFVKVAQEAKSIGHKIEFDFQIDEDSTRLIEQTGITQSLLTAICDQ